MGSQGFGGGMDPNDIFRMFMGGGMSGGMGGMGGCPGGHGGQQYSFRFA